MAERSWTKINSGVPGADLYELDAALANGDTVKELPIEQENPIIEFEANGTAGTGTLNLTGGMKTAASHPTLQDTAGNDIALTAAGVRVVASTPLFLILTLTGANGTDIWTPRLMVRRSR